MATQTLFNTRGQAKNVPCIASEGRGIPYQRALCPTPVARRTAALRVGGRTLGEKRRVQVEKHCYPFQVYQSLKPPTSTWGAFFQADVKSLHRPPPQRVGIVMPDVHRADGWRRRATRAMK